MLNVRLWSGKRSACGGPHSSRRGHKFLNFFSGRPWLSICEDIHPERNLKLSLSTRISRSGVCIYIIIEFRIKNFDSACVRDVSGGMLKTAEAIASDMSRDVAVPIDPNF